MSECSNKPRNYSIVFKLTNFSFLNLFPFYLPCCRFENYLTKLFAGFSGICGIFYLPRVLVNPLICLLSLYSTSSHFYFSWFMFLTFILLNFVFYFIWFLFIFFVLGFWWDWNIFNILSKRRNSGLSGCGAFMVFMIYDNYYLKTLPTDF